MQELTRERRQKEGMKTERMKERKKERRDE